MTTEDRNYVVLVGAISTHDCSGLDTHGPFEYAEAVAFMTKVNESLAAYKKEYGRKAFPYGTPLVHLSRMHVPPATPEGAANNWVYDPELADA